MFMTTHSEKDGVTHTYIVVNDGANDDYDDGNDEVDDDDGNYDDDHENDNDKDV